ncbi:MAG: hypothetical protein K2Y01_09380 [Rhabdochlamydiaceae bacterium]|nr:hypothetical protein [Rhabdochlamydiaceae bacterium]
MNSVEKRSIPSEKWDSSLSWIAGTTSALIVFGVVSSIFQSQKITEENTSYLWGAVCAIGAYAFSKSLNGFPCSFKRQKTEQLNIPSPVPQNDPSFVFRKIAIPSRESLTSKLPAESNYSFELRAPIYCKNALWCPAVIRDKNSKDPKDLTLLFISYPFPGLSRYPNIYVLSNSSSSKVLSDSEIQHHFLSGLNDKILSSFIRTQKDPWSNAARGVVPVDCIADLEEEKCKTAANIIAEIVTSLNVCEEMEIVRSLTLEFKVISQTTSYENIEQVRVSEALGLPIPFTPSEQRGLEIVNLLEKSRQISRFHRIYRDILLQKEISSRDINLCEQEEQDVLYSLAFKYDKYHDIHQPPISPVDPKDCALNFIWMHGRKVGEAFYTGGFDERRLYIGSDPKKTEEEQRIEFERKFVGKFLEYKDLGHESLILWTSDISEQALQNSENLFRKYGIPVTVRISEEIPYVKENRNMFYDKKFPLFLFVDALKCAIPLYQCTQKGNEKKEYSIMMDLEENPMPFNDFLDQRTVVALDKYGILFSTCGQRVVDGCKRNGCRNGFENGMVMMKSGFLGENMNEIMLKILEMNIYKNYKEKGEALRPQALYGMYEPCLEMFRYKTYKDSGDYQYPIQALTKPMNLFPSGFLKQSVR